CGRTGGRAQSRRAGAASGLGDRNWGTGLRLPAEQGDGQGGPGRGRFNAPTPAPQPGEVRPSSPRPPALVPVPPAVRGRVRVAGSRTERLAQAERCRRDRGSGVRPYVVICEGPTDNTLFS